MHSVGVLTDSILSCVCINETLTSVTVTY